MKEIEVKILNVRPSEIRRRLRLLGARRVFSRTRVHEMAFKDSSRVMRRKTTGKEERLIRLRRIGAHTELTVKGPWQRQGPAIGSREEYEVVVSDFRRAVEVLRFLGFHAYRDREKYREEWRLGSAKIEIDVYPGIPAYLEIEGKSKIHIIATAKKLGFRLQDLIAITSTEVLRRHGVKNPNYVTFG